MDNQDTLVISFGGEEEQPKTEEEVRQALREEEFIEKEILERSNKFHLPDYMIKSINDQFGEVVVQDFGDMYHLSDEERRKQNKYIDLFRAYQRTKDHPRKLKQYMYAVKAALDCLDAVAKDNKFYDPLEFKKKFLKGKIKIYGLKMPVYKGKKKGVNFEYIFEYILDGKDIEKFEDPTKRDFDTEHLSAPSTMNPIRLQYLQNLYKTSAEEGMTEEIFYDPYDYGRTDEGFVVKATDKQFKKMVKAFPDFAHAFRDYKKHSTTVYHLAQATEYIYQFGSDAFMDDINNIALYDQKYNVEIDSNEPEFKGELSSKKDVEKYLAAMYEWEKHHVKEEFDGKMRTQAEIDDIQCKRVLERNGWNIRKLYGNRDREKALRSIKKKDRLKRAAMKENLLRSNKRQYNFRKKILTLADVKALESDMKKSGGKKFIIVDDDKSKKDKKGKKKKDNSLSKKSKKKGKTVADKWRKELKADRKLAETSVMNSLGLGQKSLKKMQEELNSYFNS